MNDNANCLSMKDYAKRAKRRMASGFWDKIRQERDEYIKNNSQENPQKIKEYYSKRLMREIYFSASQDEDEELYHKVCKLLNKNDYILNPISYLIDHKEYDKLDFYAKEVLSKMNKSEISKKAYEWSKVYSPELKEFIEKDYSRFEEILNIEREKKNPRKDYAKYSDIYPVIKFFDHDIYVDMLKNTNLEFNPNISKETIKEFLKLYKEAGFALDSDENTWFSKVKEVAEKCNFCTDNKLFKQDPSKWTGCTNDACEIIRISMTLRKVTPNLFSIMKILGRDENIKRIWLEHFKMEVSHLKAAAALLKKYVQKSYEEVVGSGEFPTLLKLGSNKEYIRKVLKESITLTMKDEGYSELNKLPDDYRFFTYQEKFLSDGTKTPSHLVIEKAIKTFGKDYRYQDGEHPVKSLRDRECDNVDVARIKGN